MAHQEMFTWPDVDGALRLSMESGRWPTWLIGASAYTSGVSLEVRRGTRNGVVREWLSTLFGSSLAASDGQDVLKLSMGRELPIDIEWVDDGRGAQLRLLFGQSATIRRPTSFEPRYIEESSPIIYAFHSFKGGVGRTTSAIALANEIVASAPSARVLLIDADLEAPGISFLIEERWPDYPVSFTDLLVLANDGQDYEGACEVVAQRMEGLEIQGVCFLPAYRRNGGFEEVSVKPEHLIKNSMDPFVLSHLIRGLARRLDVDAVVVDLRAGVSEISAGLALDPAVKRVLVTTLAGQSFLGTRRLLERIGRWDRMLSRLSPDNTGFESPYVVFSQVHEDSYQRAEETFVPEILNAYMNPVGDGVDSGDETPPVSTCIVPYHGDLASLAPSWERVSAAIERADLGSALGALVGPVVARRKLMEEPLPGSGGSVADARNEQRLRIERFSDSLEFAESGTGRGFLVTDSIRNLVSDFKASLPAVPVIGKKGAGKSYMFLQLVRSRGWRAFCADAGVKSVALDADIFPILSPIYLEEEAKQLVEGARNGVAVSTGFRPLALDECRDSIRRAECLGEDESGWRRFWVEFICSSVGAENFEELIAKLRESDKRILLVADGLEDVFQSLHENKAQQAAMRSLVSEVIGWVGSQSGGRVGFVCFVRHDMVASSVRQNFGQFFQRYKQYSLRWGRVEALRLVGWVADQSGALPLPTTDELDEAKMSQALIPLWGQKLGSSNANEAHSSEWVLAALSDFRGQVQARDVVRFLKISANSSKGVSTWTDRILTPPAIRSAPEICGQKKVEEVEQESPNLKLVFKLLKEAPADRRVIPFNPADFGLELTQLELLEREGVVLREPDGYYMPEMYRRGLNFSLPRGARPRVLALARRAKGMMPFI